MSNIDIISNGIKEIYETRGNEAFTRLFYALLDDIVPNLTVERKIIDYSETGDEISILARRLDLRNVKYGNRVY